MKYTKEILEEATKNSKSIMGVLRYLGLSEASGSMHAHISSRIKEFKIDTTHFTGLKTNCGPGHKGGPRKLQANQILVRRDRGRRQDTHRLKRALLEIGRKYKCAKCGLGPKWENETLTLQIEHKNGNNLDDRKENLEFLCPNCHSQTPHYGIIKNKRPENKCKRCGKTIWQYSKTNYCHKCLWYTRSKAGVAEQADALA